MPEYFLVQKLSYRYRWRCIFGGAFYPSIAIVIQLKKLHHFSHLALETSLQRNCSSKYSAGLSVTQRQPAFKLITWHAKSRTTKSIPGLYYKFNTWKFQAQTWGEHVVFVYRNCVWHSEQFLFTTCSPHVLQKEKLLIKIYL